LATFRHPAFLNAFQQFGQACSILRTTTRVSNPAWYQPALSLNLQLHIRVAGEAITTFYHDRKTAGWSAGPALTDAVLHDPLKLEAVVAEILQNARTSGATSLGVILHVADEFATTELKPELDNPASLPELKEAAVMDPGSILEDSSIMPDQASWRVIPYPAAGSPVIGSTITVSKQFGPLLRTLRESGETHNFPIITHALSAPLVAIMGLSKTISPTPGKPFVTILQYPWFTTLAFFNEYSALRLIRTLQHRGIARPTNFRNALATTNASLEFIDPDLFVLPLGANVDTTLTADLRITFTSSRVDLIQQTAAKGLPDWCPEPAIAASPTPVATAIDESHAPLILIEAPWALQDFLPTPRELLEIFPDRSEMRLLKILRLARVALYIITVLSIGYFCYGVINLVRQPEWAFDSTQASLSKDRIGKLSIEKKKGERLSNLLADRSKAWATMESLSRLFPQGGGMMVKSYSHTAKADMSPGKTTAGFVKEWEINGLARDEALDYLNVLNTREGITAHFSEIARITGNGAYDPTIGNRNLVVNVRTQESSSYKPIPVDEANVADESTYPYTFNLTITQRFESTDPLALDVAKAP
jgi:hypothetical protein